MQLAFLLTSIAHRLFLTPFQVQGVGKLLENP